MDIQLDLDGGESPLSMKADFLLSLCELVVGGKDGLQPIEKDVYQHVYFFICMVSKQLIPVSVRDDQLRYHSNWQRYCMVEILSKPPPRT